MYLTDLALTDFRSHRETVVRLDAGVTTFSGPNGAGKTNLVEAVTYLATLGSHRVASDQPLIREGADKAIIRARLVREDRAAVVSLEIMAGQANRALLGRAKVKPTALLGVTRAVGFVPEDLVLAKGPPEVRRRYLDEMSVQVKPSMARTLSDYSQVVRQRSALLKSLAGTSGSQRREGIDGLEIWDGPAARLGAAIIHRRITLVQHLEDKVAELYGRIANGGRAKLFYRPSVEVADGDGPEAIEAKLLEAMTGGRDKEIERGLTLYGPHREDLTLALNGRPARGYASHGESWSLALALRLGEFQVIRDEMADDPILILDDVFAELDMTRRQALTKLVEGVEQVLVTAAVKRDVPDGLASHWHAVSEGQVLADDAASG
ncbi:MAG: DNA replication/repair protein RecF [Bifidobacteriaceae bacterium]|jgi:DNA replication and repair protein RecF|nr:DNA replication/repair protein RecF [Bifidobacteriaceae bacterium]